MTRQRAKEWLDLVAAFAIVAGLVPVACDVQQASIVAKTQTDDSVRCRPIASRFWVSSPVVNADEKTPLVTLLAYLIQMSTRSLARFIIFLRSSASAFLLSSSSSGGIALNAASIAISFASAKLMFISRNSCSILSSTKFDKSFSKGIERSSL